MSEGLQTIEQQAAPTPMLLLQMAMTQGADLDKMQKLMELQERWEANEARKAFVAAMSKFKENPPIIIKDKQVAFGNTKYKHAELDQVCSVIGHALSEVGISHRWTTFQVDGVIRVTCILTHVLGHSEQVTLEAPPDTSGQKNSIQAVASAVTYLERYTLLAATGMATGEGDNDGGGFGMPEDTFQSHLKAIREAANIEQLQKVYATAYSAAKSDKPTQAAIIKAKDERKAQLRSAS